MHNPHPEWLHFMGQSLTLALLLAGAWLFLRLLWQWRCGSALFTRASVIRLRTRSWCPLDTALLLLAIMLPMASALPGLVKPSVHAATPPPGISQIAFMVFYYAVILAGVAIAAKRAETGVGAALGITRKTLWPSVRSGFVLGLAMLPPVILAAWLAEWPLRWLGVSIERQPAFDMLTDPSLGAGAQALLILVAVVVAPLAEEAVFRGVLLPVALRTRGVLGAMLLVNVLFALLHLHAPSVIPLLTVGVGLSLGMLATGSLLTPVIMHAVFNGVMLMIFYAWPALAS